MKVGIICEYNPFHNGHLYHLNEVKKLYKDATIVLILSGNFTERGNISLLNKWDKTRISLEFGIDLVVELPFCFASQSADIFAKGAISLLDYLKVDVLVFGSEINDIDKLKEVANIQLTNKDYDSYVKKYLDDGYNYPTALGKALNHFTDFIPSSPNDLLGLSYIKQIISLNSNIKPVCIKRTNDFHSVNSDGSIISASGIRNLIKNNEDISLYVPFIVTKYCLKSLCLDSYFNYLKYKIITSDDLSIYQTVDEGLDKRIKRVINDCDSFDELIDKVKTKRYTYNKLSRMFTHIVCGFTKEEASKYNSIRYIRVLGFSSKGRSYLNEIKKDIDIDIVTNYSKYDDDMLRLEERVSGVYSLITGCKVSELEGPYKK